MKMKNNEKIIFLLLLVLYIGGCGDDNVKDNQSTMHPGQIKDVSFTQVHLNDAFWAPRMEINRTVSIPSAFYQCEINGRFDNFALAGGLIDGEHQGDFSFDDTDPYKIIEGASYSLAMKYDPKLDAYLDSVIALITAAQEDDGYLTTCVTNRATRLAGWWGSSRWERINSHELYNSGHLYEAAVAHYKATGKRTLLEVAIKNADLVCDVFGLGEDQIHYPSGHPIIEMALVKLYKVTGKEKYLDQARYFVDEAGQLTNGRKPGIYSQDHVPVREQSEIVGHAVRAGYFFSGATDIASLQQDKELFEAVSRVWDNMAESKLYITGGVGSRAQGEGFGPDYELNNFNNYCETCASIANVYWNHRMFLATGESKYIDVLERTLYNGLIAGVSLGGDKFFYDNPLASLGGHQRQKWFGCACCPGNITRFMASVPGYVYAIQYNSIYVNLFVESNSTLELPGGQIELAQVSNYPWSGDVEIKVNRTIPRKFALHIRIPGWARNRPVPTDLYHYVDKAKPEVRLTVNDVPVKMKTADGYVVIDRKWSPGDKVSLHMNMPVRRTQANDKVEYNKGLLSIERGPILYALEGIDQPDQYLFDVVIPRGSEISAYYDKSLLNGVVVLEGEAFKVIRHGKEGHIEEKPFIFKAIPYNTWNNRGPGQLIVWTPEAAEYAILHPQPTMASQAEQVGGWGFNDQMEPKSSSDLNTPYYYWWLKNGSEESIGYRFDEPKEISAVEVYWLAFEHYDVIYKVPEYWKLYYKEADSDSWKEVENASEYTVEKDQYNKVTFNPVVTTDLKLVAKLQGPDDNPEINNDNKLQVPDIGKNGYSGGVIEWKVY
jgi:hypothetical protein